MKKTITIFIILVLIAAMPITAFAATGINAYEQAVLDLLDSTIVLGENDWTYEIPQKYIITAKNFFAGDCDMTETEKDAIIAYIKSGIDVVKKDSVAQKATKKSFSLAKMSAQARAAVLDAGTRACAEVDLQLTYNSADNTVKITKKGSSTPVFESAAVIKATGEAITVNAAFISATVLACLVLGTYMIFTVSKKTGLFVK